MPFSLKDLGWGVLVPLLLAAALRIALAVLMDRLVPAEAPVEPARSKSASSKASGRRVFAWETCLPYAAGVAVGYFMLNLGPLRPEAHYQWLPAAIGLATIAPCLADAVGGPVALRVGARILLYAATGAVAGYLLMPTWDDLAFPYTVYLTAWIAAVFSLALAADLPGAVADRDQNHEWPWAMVVLGTCLATAAVVALSESLRFAQMASLAFSASLGVVLAGLVRRKPPFPGMNLPVMVHLAGILLVAQVNSYSNVPWISYLLPLSGLAVALGASWLVPSTASAVLRSSVVIFLAAISSAAAVILAALPG